MDSLRVRRFRARYHLPPSRQSERVRLDRLLRQMLDEALERAVEQAGISAHEIVCVRSLDVPVRLRLSAADSALILAWSRALADAIRRAAEGYPSAAVVRYTSPVHVLVDMAAGVARERYERAWAWRAASVWRLSDAPGRSEAIFELVRALLDLPQAIVAVLRALALSRVVEARALESLVARIGASQWIRLAQAALMEAGCDVAIVEAEQVPGIAEVVQSARRVARSAFAQALVAAVAPLLEDAETRRAFAVLLIMAEEPAALRTADRAQALTSAVADVLHPAAASGEVRSAQRNVKPASGEQVSPRREPDYDARPESEPPADLRQRARTRYGGLLFLLGLIEELDLLSAMEAGMPGRPFRWILHRLALNLVPADADDPAALAFAGLSPDADPPSVAEDPASEAELALCAEWARRIREQLREWIDEPEPVSFVCYRDAEIVADPGWIEVRLSLRDVSTAIRRAGLDLDPGFVPWLGVVVRFVYE